MGLDITAYSNLKPISKHTDEWCDVDGHIEAYAYDVFPQSFRGIPILGSREFGSGDMFLIGGCYVPTDATRTASFHAGNYGGYGAWRQDLALQFNPDVEIDAPFYELIWFADNEGTIGPKAAKDLLADFREHADRYSPLRDVPWWRDNYALWMNACELAAEDGLIDFH